MGVYLVILYIHSNLDTFNASKILFGVLKYFFRVIITILYVEVPTVKKMD